MACARRKAAFARRHPAAVWRRRHLHEHVQSRARSRWRPVADHRRCADRRRRRRCAPGARARPGGSSFGAPTTSLAMSTSLHAAAHQRLGLAHLLAAHAHGAACDLRAARSARTCGTWHAAARAPLRPGSVRFSVSRLRSKASRSSSSAGVSTSASGMPTAAGGGRAEDVGAVMVRGSGMEGVKAQPSRRAATPHASRVVPSSKYTALWRPITLQRLVARYGRRESLRSEGARARGAILACSAGGRRAERSYERGRCGEERTTRRLCALLGLLYSQPATAEPMGREQALAVLPSDDVQARRSAVVELGKAGQMADVDEIARCAVRRGRGVRGLAERPVRRVWSRSGTRRWTRSSRAESATWTTAGWARGGRRLYPRHRDPPRVRGGVESVPPRTT